MISMIPRVEGDFPQFKLDRLLVAIRNRVNIDSFCVLLQVLDNFVVEA